MNEVSDSLPGADTQSLLERISELEEQVANLRRLEGAAQRNVELFEALLAASHDGITLTRPDGTTIRVVCSVLGYSGQNVYGTNFKALVHPEDRHVMEESFRKVVQEGSKYAEYEVRLMRGDGTYAWVECSMTDMLDNPAVAAIVHNYRDVTLRRRQDWTIRELNGVLEKSPYAAFSESLDGEIVTWHPSAERTFGYSCDEMIGSPASLLAPPEQRAEVARMRASVLDKGCSSAPFHTRAIRKDGVCLDIELALIPIIIHGRICGVAHLSRPV